MYQRYSPCVLSLKIMFTFFQGRSRQGPSREGHRGSYKRGYWAQGKPLQSYGPAGKTSYLKTVV